MRCASNANSAEPGGDVEGAIVGSVRMLDKRERLDWDYDEDADVLYVSIGRPKKATGVDIGQGVIVRYDEKRKEVVGVTIMGMRARLAESLEKA